ncbi:hypothetical protein CW357_11260 [Rummeliibacillus sp. TYF005]|nr:hypothetical protein CW357_11260 [Rummeliibacillus sp. TYF005]
MATVYSLQNKLYSLSQRFKSSLQRTQAAKNTPIIRGKITRLTKQLGRVKGEAIRYLDKIMCIYSPFGVKKFGFYLLLFIKIIRNK